jgi:GH24 family phage-related lysozyme (muramidase)
MNRFERTVRRVITRELTPEQWAEAIKICEQMETVPFIRSKLLKEINRGDLSSLTKSDLADPRISLKKGKK